MTPGELQAWSLGYQRRINRESWLAGVYEMYAVMAVLSPLVADKKRGRSAFTYPDVPDPNFSPQTDDEKRQFAENERLKAILYFRQLERTLSERFKDTDRTAGDE